METVNEAILKKVKGLLAIAHDENNDEESQSAFLLAQKLMMKHRITMEMVEDAGDTNSIESGQVTSYKQLIWWESILGDIISKNFRVKLYFNSKRVGKKRAKQSIIFYGFESDVQLAKEMYFLAYDAITHYAKRYADYFYKENLYPRTVATTKKVKDSYIKGFLSGMNEKFEEQVSSMQQEYGLMVLVPQEVEQGYEELTKSSATKKISSPNATVSDAYYNGFKQGKEIDYTKSTIDTKG